MNQGASSLGWNTPYLGAGSNGGYNCTTDAEYDTFDIKVVVHDLGSGNGFRVTAYQRVHKTTDPSANAAMTWFQMYGAPGYQDVPEAAGIDKTQLRPFALAGNADVPAGGATISWSKVVAVQGTPSTVWVDGSWAGSYEGQVVGGHAYGIDAFSTIQAGISAVTSGGTVNVAAGNYPERLTIPEPLTLSGAGVGLSIIDATSFSTQGNVIDITALTGNTKIQGFDIKTGNKSNGIHSSGGTDAAGKIEILNNHIISPDNSVEGMTNMGSSADMVMYAI